MDSVVNSALEEICCGAANGLHLSDLWAKISPILAARGLPICPNVKREVWENLMEIPGLKLVACYGASSSTPTEVLIKSTAEECEKMNVKIVAPEAMRRSFLGIYELGTSESTSAGIQRFVLERLAVARNNGIPQSDLTKELHIPANNLSYQFKTLETQGLLVKQPTVIRKNDTIVATNMLYLARYAKHLGSQQRLEITRKNQLLMDGEAADGHTGTQDDLASNIVAEDVQVKDFLPALKAICEKLEKAKGKVLVVSDIKKDLNYRGNHGHKSWRNLCHRLKDARVVEECCTIINNKEVDCLRLLRSFSTSLFEPKLHGRGPDDIDIEQSPNFLKRGQITEELVELPILRQAYDMIDAAGSKGLTNTDVCRRLGLCSKEYHRRYFKPLMSKFGVHSLKESHKKGEVCRLWTTGNFKSEASNMAPIEGETVLQEVHESKSLFADRYRLEDSSQLVQVLDTTISVRNNSGNIESDAAAVTEASNCSTVDGEGSSGLLVRCNTQNSDVEQCHGVLAEELSQGSKSVPNCNMLETHCLSLVNSPRRRSHPRPSSLAMRATSSLREQRILKILEEEKFLSKAELHRHLESLETEKNTMMDRKTLERSLNKLQQEGHCKCIHVSVPGVTNCGRSRTTEVVLHPSVCNVSQDLLTQIHDKMRSFEIQLRKQSCMRQKKNQPVPILDNVQRIPCRINQSEHIGLMRANGFVLAKMVRTRLLHTFLWDWVCSSADRDHALFSSNHSYDLENPHSSCKLFELDLAIKSMPLELFLQVVGSTQKFEDVLGECKRGLLLCDLTMEERKGLMETRATSRLSWLIDILRRLKLIRLVSKGHAEDGSSNPHATLTHALELKPYLEEPTSGIASSGLVSADLRPQVRHDFVLSSKKAVDDYWSTLEYCYAAAKSRAALLAFPGCAVNEVFHPKSWASARVMTAGQRVELLKRVAQDGTKKKLSFEECEKIAEDLNLTLEQVLRVYYDKRQRSVTRFRSVLDAEGEELQKVKGKCITSSRKRRRVSDRMSSKLVNGHSGLEAADSLLDPDNQCTMEQGSLSITTEDDDCQPLRNSAGSNRECLGVEKLSEEDEEVYTFIHKQALSRLNPIRRKKFSWTEEAERQLVIEYAGFRAARGANFHRADWVSMSNLPASPDACKRRMASLNRSIPFRKAVLKLSTLLSEQYAKYLEKFQDNTSSHASGEMIRSPASGEALPDMLGRWANFDDNFIKVALDDVLRCKRMAKMDAPQDTFSEQENSEDDDNKDCGKSKASGQRSSSRQLLRKNFHRSKNARISRQMHESVAVANAAELFKLIFLSKSTAPEAPTLLAETLRHYSEHDLYAAFNYLREKKIMVGGSKGSGSFVLSQHFFHSITSSVFPTDTGSRAAKFAIWLHERENDLVEEGIEVPSDVQCGEVFSLCALVSSGELSITPCLPNEGVGEAEDNRPSKRKSDNSEPDGGLSKKLKKTFTGEGELISRREKGFPGIKLCLHRETISRSLAIDSFKDNMYPAPFLDGKDQSNTLSGLDASSSLLHSDVAVHVSNILGSSTTVHPMNLDVSESSWEAMSSYAKHLLSSCSYEVNTLLLQPDLFKTLYSAIQKSGDNGLSLKEIQKVLNIKDERILDVTIEVLGAFGRALKVNAYNSIHVVDSLYRSKYFLTNICDAAAAHHLKWKRKTENEPMPLNLDNQRENLATFEDENNRKDNDMHRVTILNRPEDVTDPPSKILTGNKITGYQDSDVTPPETSRVENLECHYTDAQICRPLLPWMNGDGTTVNELLYTGLLRRVLGIVVLNPGIIEDEIINQMQGLNPQSCRQLLEIMVLDKHITRRKMQQITSAQPPSILANLLGDKFRKSKFLSRVHYFANPSSTTLL
ncbi:hypothetical protein C2S53_014880 [Perilla frutescens var. hirtella]|uniref:B-block binding subunit of TFIIIC domain-containing protein n=1 Tax=Perilla frutescens var. hirtella TaxID=608512 RepID=A0AAD4P5Q9_PERFH|nr:hypothetical protein C2S53_014880 [Perilla frutescens var. hirtella]